MWIGALLDDLYGAFISQASIHEVLGGLLDVITDVSFLLMLFVEPARHLPVLVLAGQHKELLIRLRYLTLIVYAQTVLGIVNGAIAHTERLR